MRRARAKLTRANLAAAGVLSLLVALAPAAAEGQDRLVLQGIAVVEAWATDSGSRLLTRNDGHAALLGRLQVFGGFELSPTLQLVALGELEGGKATTEGETELSIDQLVLRFVPARLFVVEAGKFVSPVGTFGPRRLSTTNPLIGVPDGYPIRYPWGVEAFGASDRFDYRVALTSLPVTHDGFVPDPSGTIRPALGAGFTPTTGVRIGASYTRGPYLNRDLGAALPPGVDWKQVKQELVAFDGRFSRGYFEFSAELALSSYDVPDQATQHGITYYAELKYTWLPRFFTALRLERNDYAFIRPRSGAPWVARTVDFYDGEVGIGYRPTATTLAKVSVRADRWLVDANLKPFLPNGYAVAVQLSQQFDVKSWFTRRR